MYNNTVQWTNVKAKVFYNILYVGLSSSFVKNYLYPLFFGFDIKVNEFMNGCYWEEKKRRTESFILSQNLSEKKCIECRDSCDCIPN